MHKLTSLKYLSWLMLLLPLIALLVAWDYLPEEVPIHSSGGGSDRWGSRDDFGGLIVAVTGMFALLSYAVLQIASSFQPMTPIELAKAYLGISVGSSLMGFAVLLMGLLSSR